MSAKKDLDDKIALWNDQYEGILPAKDSPWKACSNLNIPLTTWQVDTAKSQICRTILATKPIWRVEGRSSEDEDKARNWEYWLQYLAERQLGLDGKLSELCLAALKHGTAIAKLTLDRRMERVRRATQDPMTGGETVDEQTLSRVGPRLDYVALRNFVLIPAEARSIASAVAVGDRKYLRLEEIKQRERLGIFREGTARRLEGKAPSQEGETEMHAAIGVAPNRGDVKQLDKYEHWELIWALPIRKTDKGFAYDERSGDEQDCLINLIKLGGTAVFARVIIYPWFHNRRHYIPFRILPREGEFYGRSFTGMLKDIQDELNTEHNQRVDLGTLRNNPPIKQVRGAKIVDAYGRSHIVFGPGATILVEDMQSAEWWVPPDRPASSFQEEAGLVEYAERLTAITEARVGRTEAGRKTLGEVELVEAQGNIRFDEMLTTFQGTSDFEEGSGLRELAYQLMGLTYQYASPNEQFRVLGDEGYIDSTLQKPQDLEEAIGAYDYIPIGNTLSSNKQRVRQEELLLYREEMANPLIIQDPTKMWEATRRLLLAFDVKDWRKLIGSEEELKKMAEMQMMAAMSGQMDGMMGQGQGQRPEAQAGAAA